MSANRSAALAVPLHQGDADEGVKTPGAEQRSRWAG
jgi:hypothetical protein